MVKSDMSVEMVELMSHLDLRIHKDRLTKQNTTRVEITPLIIREEDSLTSQNMQLGQEELSHYGKSSEIQADSGDLQGDEMEVDNLENGSNEQNQQNTNQTKSCSTPDAGTVSCINCKKMFPMDKPVS